MSTTPHLSNPVPHRWPEPAPTTPATLPTRLDVEVVILGAGIHGCALARELTLRGKRAAVVDCGGVGGGTSQWSSQLLHGGIRYLRTGDWRQMREGLAERATWMRLAPTRCRWEAFWMPHRNWVGGLTHRVGIGLYEWWGRHRPNWPAHLRLGPVPDADFHRDPRSRGSPFQGAVAYSDLLTHDRDLVRDLALASQPLATVLDFHTVERFDDHPTRLQAVWLRDRRDATQRRVAAAQFVAALGPWTDSALAHWWEDPPRLRLSAGIHLWFDAIVGCDRPWTLERPNGRVLFIIPRDGQIQVGTTERDVNSGFAEVVAAERDDLLNALSENCPTIPWRHLPIRAEESGVRPLLRGDGHSSRLSREARLLTHPRYSNLTVVLGGKLTTARALMSQLATRLTGQACPASQFTPLVPARPTNEPQNETATA